MAECAWVSTWATATINMNEYLDDGVGGLGVARRAARSGAGHRQLLHAEAGGAAARGAAG